jgi:hypothetical protein
MAATMIPIIFLLIFVDFFFSIIFPPYEFIVLKPIKAVFE